MGMVDFKRCSTESYEADGRLDQTECSRLMSKKGRDVISDQRLSISSLLGVLGSLRLCGVYGVLD